MSWLRKIVPFLTAAAALLAACRKPIVAWLRERDADALAATVSGYNHAIIGMNYFENGFVRRGLGGTLMILLDGNADMMAALKFFVLSAIWFLIPATVLLRRLAAADPGWNWLWFALVFVLSPQLFIGWGSDVGRGDMLVMGFIAWAVIAALAGRYRLAVAPIIGGMLAHDSALFFGVPLVTAMWFRAYRASTATRGDGIGALLVLIAAIVVVSGLQYEFGGTAQEAAATIMRHDPVMGQLAAYFTVGGYREAIASACLSLSRRKFPLYIASCYVFILIYAVLYLYRRRASWLFFAFATVLPMTALSLIAFDYGRWLMFAVGNAWLGAVVLRLVGAEPFAISRTDYARGTVSLIVLLAMRQGAVYYAAAGVDDLATWIWGPTPVFEQSVADCDPGWQTAIGLGPKR